MKYLLLFFLIPFLLTCSKIKSGEIIKVEHVYISTPDASKVFATLKDQFGWPVVWNYQDWGPFESGGLSLGNTVLEIMMSPAEKPGKRYGMALAPNCSVHQFIPILDTARITQGPPQKAAHWSIMTLKHLMPESVDVFLCDYHDRDRIQRERQKAAAELHLDGNNRLGILRLQEIVVSNEQPQRFEAEWAKLPGIIKTENRFAFTEGPDVKFVAADQFSLSLRIKVQSLRQTKTELDTLGFKTADSTQGLQLISDEFDIQIHFIE